MSGEMHRSDGDDTAHAYPDVETIGRPEQDEKTRLVKSKEKEIQWRRGSPQLNELTNALSNVQCANPNVGVRTG